MRALLFVVALTACGSETTTVSLAVPGEPSFFKGQIDGQPWQTFTGTFDGRATTYELAIDGDFELALACEYRSGTFVAGEVFGTVDDAIVTIGTWHVPSCVEVENVTPVPVIGRLDTSGQIAIADTMQLISEDDTSFSLLVTPGVRDIIFTSTRFDLSIRHDVAITTATDLGALPYPASPMMTNDYTAALTPDEAAVAWTQVVTRNGTTLTFPFDPKTSVFAPSDQLDYGDAQTYHFVAQGSGTSRSAVVSGFAITPPPFELLAQVMPCAWTTGEHAVRWTPTPDFYSTVSIEF